MNKIDPKLLEEIESLTQQLIISPTQCSLYEQRGEAYYNIYVQIYIQSDENNRNRDTAISYLKKAICDHQAAIECGTQTEQKEIVNAAYFGLYLAYQNCGGIYASFGDYHDAISIYQQALHQQPQTKRSNMFLDKFYNDLGFCYQQLKNYSEAIAYYTKSLEIREMNWEAYYHRAQCYYEIKAYDLAIQDLKDAGEYDDVGWNTNDIMIELERCYAAVKEHEKDNVRKDEQQKLCAALSITLQNIAYPNIQRQEVIPQKSLNSEVFKKDVESLKTQIQQRLSSEELKEASLTFTLIEDIIKIGQVGEIDAEAAIAKARKVAEFVAQDLYITRHQSKKAGKLVDMIQWLNEQNILPSKIYEYFEEVRKVGNRSVHASLNPSQKVDVTEVSRIGMFTARIVEWYIMSNV